MSPSPLVRFRNLLRQVEQLPISVAVFDYRMRYLAASQCWHARFPGCHRALAGRRLDGLPERLPGSWREVLPRCLTGASQSFREDHWIGADGSPQALRWALNPWYRDDGRIGGVTMFTEDLVGGSDAPVAARDAGLTPAQMSAATQTAAAIAHELNQPIGAISAYCASLEGLLTDADASSEAIRRALRGVTQQSSRAGRLIHELLDFLHCSAAGTEAVDINRMVLECLETLAESPYRGTSAVSDLAPGAPQAVGSPVQIRSVLRNLLHNALEAMHGAGMGLDGMRLLVRTRGTPDCVTVTVEDNGPGFDAVLAERIFEPFFTTKPNGTGLGLAISRSLVEVQGGRIWADPGAGTGARLHLQLPVMR